MDWITTTVEYIKNVPAIMAGIIFIVTIGGILFAFSKNWKKPTKK